MKEAERNASDQTTVTEMKNCFNGAIRLHTPEGRISELEDISKETFQTEKQREQHFVVLGQLQKL